MFAGNVSEATTLQKMLADLGALPGATVVMDAGIATEANLVWLKLHGHPYVVVSRKQARQFDCDQVIEVQTAGQQAIQVQRVQAPGSGEAMLYCHSPARADKDRAIDTNLAQRFERARQKLVVGLAKPRGAKDPDKIRERIGRPREKYARAAQHDAIDMTRDESGKTVTAISWSNHLEQDAEAWLRPHPSWRLLLTHHADGAERRRAVADLFHAHPPGSGVPLAQD